MNLDEYLSSPEFKAFQDETLRNEAVRAVEKIHQIAGGVKRHQLHGIQGVIQGAGLKGLVDLAVKQKEKNKSVNKVFWAEIDGLLSKMGGSEISLFHFIRAILMEKGFIENEDAVEDRVEQRRVRKNNNQQIEIVMENALGVYFEHFVCHYFSKNP
jgi:hypothetical protein